MDKKRILVYTESYLPSVGGLENNTILLCHTLHELGHIVTLLTPQKNALTSSEFQVIESKSIKQYFQVVAQHNIVLVNGGISFKIIFPALLVNKPYVVIYQMASLFKNIHSASFKTKFTNTIRKQLAKKAKFNVAVSRYSFAELAGFFGEQKSRLLINPASPLFERKESVVFQKETFDCLFAGRLIEGKGVRLLINAIEKLRAENLPFNLHIVGEGPEEAWVNEKLHLGYIFLYPPAPPEKLKDWYQNVQLTVIPSTSHIEGSPLVMAESLVMGAPVLVADQPAMKVSVMCENMCFISGDLDDLVQKLRAMLDAKTYHEVEAHSKHLAKDYAYENYVDHLEKIVNA